METLHDEIKGKQEGEGTVTESVSGGILKHLGSLVKIRNFSSRFYVKLFHCIKSSHMSPTRLSLSLSLFLSLPVASSSGVQLITVAIRTECVCVCVHPCR